MSFEVKGKITRIDNQQGIHGIRVEVWDAKHVSEGPLGVVLTNHDGSYSLDIHGKKLNIDCCECSEIYIKLRDRDCRLLYDGCSDRHCCEPGKPQHIDVEIPPQGLWWHLSRPLSWVRIKEPLVPVRVMQEIEDALELLQQDGLSKDIASIKLAICATPLIEGFDEILQDAWSTLQGDPQAAQRYREILDVLCGTEAVCCGQHPSFELEIEEIFNGACGDSSSADCKEPESCVTCNSKQCAGDKCGCSSLLISKDKALLLIMAALHIACGRQILAKKYLQVLLTQFSNFQTLGALHAASVGALLGDTAKKTHMRDLLELLCTQCSTDKDKTSCLLRLPPGCCSPCLDPTLADCIREAIKQWCIIRCYHICEVRPSRACPGEEILIVGCGFGINPENVLFSCKNGGLTCSAVPVKSWCDDRIAVIVPQGAGCGMWLEMPPLTITICDRFLELRPIGCIDKGFEGTSPEILRFNIKGHTTGECPLQPGEPLRIRWNTCAADSVRIELIDLANNNIIAAQDPAALNGRWDFAATNFTRTKRLRVRIIAFGRCEPPQASRQIDLVFQKQPNLQIRGLEITQAIQHYHASEHLTDPADGGTDNSLRLVTNKTAWVRAYLRSGQDPTFDNGQLDNINGTLRVDRRVNGVWGEIALLTPQNGPITAEDNFANYNAERGNINTTLNFVIPANLMNGLLRFTVDVLGPFAPCPGYVANHSTQVDVNLQQTLSAAFFTIGYNGPNAARTGNIILPAPTLATCQAETNWAMTTYPVSGVSNVRIAGTFVTNTPIDDPRSCDGCCSPNWVPLLNQIQALVALDQAANPGTPWVYYGIIASGIPVNVPGCSGSATGGVAGQSITYAHEIGHQFGLPHARCGNAGSGNPSYPVYEPYDLPVDPPGTTNWTMASIGEYGLDINNGAIANPNDFEDFMSYCGPRWISKFTHNFLTNIAQLTPVVIPSGAMASPRIIEDNSPGFEPDTLKVLPFIHIMGTIGFDNAVEVNSVARIDTCYLRGDGRQSDYIMQLLDTKGRVLVEDVLYVYDNEGCCGNKRTTRDWRCESLSKPIPFKVLLHDTAPGSSLRIIKHDKVVWERKGADKPPSINRARALLNKNGDLELTWQLACESKEEVDVWVRWTKDDGKTWHALTVGLHGSSTMISSEQLPSGRLRFELLAHDGFYTVRATTDAVTIPAKPPSVTILYPGTRSRVYKDKQMHLWGSVSSFAGALIGADAAEWFIDDKPVGSGLDIWVENPGEGYHRVRLRVTEAGLTNEVSSDIEVK